MPMVAMLPRIFVVSSVTPSPTISHPLAVLSDRTHSPAALAPLACR